MSYSSIHFEMRGAVAVITLNRPDALNALNLELGDEIIRAFDEARELGARAIVLTGAGRAFCAGGDLREMQKIVQQEGRLEAFFDKPLQLLHDGIVRIREIPIPVVAAVNGFASGAGCNLALACDIVFAAESAKFNEAFVKIGLTPDCGGTFVLPRLVGMKRAAEMLMTGELVEAKTAFEIGMINRVVPYDRLLDSAIEFAQKLAAMPTASIGRIKKLLDASATNGFAAQLEMERQLQLESGQTRDFKEGVAAFIEKRPPNFEGR